MNPFDFSILYFPSIVILLITLICTFRLTSSFIGSIIASAIKACIFLIYFGVIFDGTYTFLDDWAYLDGGEKLLNMNASVLDIYFNLDSILSVSGGEHFVYYIYNLYAFKIFGIYYFSPVAINVILTVFVAYFGSKLTKKEFLLSKKKERYFYFFLLFYPDIVAWSTVMNGKDTLVLLLHIILLMAVSMLYRGKKLHFFFLGAFASTILSYLRYYVPVLFSAAVVLGIFFHGRSSFYKRLLFFSSATIFASLILFRIGLSGIESGFDSINDYLINPFYGFIRIILTPIPFKIEEAYKFLTIPMIINWICFPFLIIGAVKIWKINTIFTRFFLVYLFCFLFFYGIYGELQGPRHRVQLDYALALLHFFGLFMQRTEKATYQTDLSSL